MTSLLQQSSPIGAWSGKTPLEDFVLHRTGKSIKDLEEELVAAIYEQRHWEHEIMCFSPQSKAAANVIQSFNASKLKVQEIELKLRKLRHFF